MDLHKQILIASVMNGLVPKLAAAQRARLHQWHRAEADQYAAQPRSFLHARGLSVYAAHPLVMRGFNQQALHPFVAQCAAKAGYTLLSQPALTGIEERKLCRFLVCHYISRQQYTTGRQAAFFQAAIRDNCARYEYSAS